MWDFDRFGKNQFLGEVQLPLSSADLNDHTPHWHTLQEKVLLTDTSCVYVRRHTVKCPVELFIVESASF